MITACAIMAVYNEADIIRESISKLIEHGIDVYLIDNASTDGTVDRVSDLVGRGIIDIEPVRFLENGREVYAWTDLLKLKERVARRLGYDWYLHVDGDEIRYSPWPGISLREGLDRVDASGYNLINFKLFNFRLLEGAASGPEFESAMPYFSGAERFNQRQVKGWKADQAVDITPDGGHQVVVSDPRLFPIRFILKHYPVRSFEHGRRKILTERKLRFSQAERERGWHVQYDHMADISAADVYWDASKLTLYDHEHECLEIQTEANMVLCETLAELRGATRGLNEAHFPGYWIEILTQEGASPQRAQELVRVAQGLAQLLQTQQNIPPIQSGTEDAKILRRLVASLARIRYLTGSPLLFEQLPLLRFV